MVLSWGPGSKGAKIYDSVLCAMSTPTPPSKGGPTECGRAYMSLSRGKYEAQIYSDDSCELPREELVGFINSESLIPEILGRSAVVGHTSSRLRWRVRPEGVVSGKSICIDLQGISDRAVHCR